MSLLKALFEASRPATDDPALAVEALSTIRSLLATETLSIEDLATAEVYDLSQAARDKGAAVCMFTVDDVKDHFDGPELAAAGWLILYRRNLEDLMSTRGNEAITDLLAGDGLLADNEDEDNAEYEIEPFVLRIEGESDVTYETEAEAEAAGVASGQDYEVVPRFEQ